MKLRNPLKGSSKVVVFGVAGVVLVAVALLGSIYKPQIQTWLMDGDYRTVYVPANHFLLENVSVVKVSGVDVGTVDEVHREPDGTGSLVIKVADGVTAAVGSAPSAALRPHTLLGGKYYVEIRSGGDRESEWVAPIPEDRSRLPVELDEVAQSLQPHALDGATASVRQFDKTLGAGGTESLQELLDGAPDTFRPGAKVLEALRGRNSRTDLTTLVSGLDATADELTKRAGRLQQTLADLRGTASALADGSGSLATAVDRLPSTLDTVSAGMSDLRTTLRKLRETSEPVRPVVRELGTMVRNSDPVLRRAVPVVKDLRTAMNDARPLLSELVPVSERGTELLNRAEGPVLDRINGPIKEAVLTPYRGQGPYQNTSSDVPFHQALGHMFSGLNGTGAYHDANGHAVAFQPGGGIGTVSGIGPYSLEEMFQHLILGKEQR